MGGSQFAIEWVRKRYKLKGFMFSTYIFFPMLLLAYLFLELIPYYSGMTKTLVKFDIPTMLYQVFKDESDKCDD
jgi:heme/copper-type cytochrome/quinol oxidase subunit 3